MIVIRSQTWLLIIIDNFIVYWVKTFCYEVTNNTVNYGHESCLDLVTTELGD